jgi:hypothetical protein
MHQLYAMIRCHGKTCHRRRPPQRRGPSRPEPRGHPAARAAGGGPPPSRHVEDRPGVPLAWHPCGQVLIRGRRAPPMEPGPGGVARMSWRVNGFLAHTGAAPRFSYPTGARQPDSASARLVAGSGAARRATRPGVNPRSRYVQSPSGYAHAASQEPAAPAAGADAGERERRPAARGGPTRGARRAALPRVMAGFAPGAHATPSGSNRTRAALLAGRGSCTACP